MKIPVIRGRDHPHFSLEEETVPFKAFQGKVTTAVVAQLETPPSKWAFCLKILDPPHTHTEKPNHPRVPFHMVWLLGPTATQDTEDGM